MIWLALLFAVIACWAWFCPSAQIIPDTFERIEKLFRRNRQ